jgi:hypothetical protein
MKFRELGNTLGANWMQKELKERISKKWDELYNYPAKVAERHPRTIQKKYVKFRKPFKKPITEPHYLEIPVKVENLENVLPETFNLDYPNINPAKVAILKPKRFHPSWWDNWNPNIQTRQKYTLDKIYFYLQDYIKETFPNYQDDVCEVTGLPIFMQKKGSVNLGKQGALFYYKNYPEIWELLNNLLVGSEYENVPLEGKNGRFYHIAHTIRNAKYNASNNYKRDSGNRGPKLFDDTPFQSDKLKIKKIRSVYFKH